MDSELVQEICDDGVGVGDGLRVAAYFLLYFDCGLVAKALFPTYSMSYSRDERRTIPYLCINPQSFDSPS